MSFTRVAIAGATGNLGPSIVKALISNHFQVFAFSRSGNTKDLPSVVKTVKVDYESHASIVDGLKSNNIEVLISNITPADSQIQLIDAAIEAGVKRFLPAEFGADVYGNAKCRELPVFKKSKIPVQQYLKKQSDENKISWTIIVTSTFFDYGLRIPFLINPQEGGVTQLVDNPNRKFSTTLLSDVGQAVVGVLQHPEETMNRAVYTQSTSISQNEVLAAAKKAKPGVEFKTEKVNSEELLEQSSKIMESGKKEDFPTAIRSQIKVSIMNEDYGADFSVKNDNKLLRIKMLSAKEVEDIIKQNVV